jgi:diguanylate cyclase (GGDEF)-like protein/PAS domain S-box-containing protein
MADPDASAGLKTLVYQRDVSRRLTLHALLQFRQHAVTLLESADQARKALATGGSFDIVVLEWGEDAALLCAEIRASQGDRPVLLAQGAAETHQAMLAALDAGADEVLPNNVDDLAFHARLVRAEARARNAIERARGHEEQLRLRKAVETMQIGVSLTDPEGRILYVNPAEAGMHGYRVEELTGDDARILSPRHQWRRLTAGEMKQVRRWKRERVRLRKDGSTFPVQLISDAVLDADGQPLGLVTTCEDISERTASEAALRDSEQRYRSLVEHARDAIATLARDGTVTSLNPAFEQLVNAPVSSWAGRRFSALVHPDDAPALETLIKRVTSGKPTHPVELRIHAGSDDYRVLEAVATPDMRDSTVVGVVVIARDVAAQKAAQQRQTTLVAVNRILSGASALEDVAPRVLQAVCVGLGWQAAFLWLADPDGQRMAWRGGWHLPALQLSELEATAHTTLIHPGKGALGQVWQDGAWTFLPDIQRDRNASLVPIASSGEVVGVLELFRRDPARPSEAAIATLHEIGSEMARFVKRRRMEEALRTSEERYALAVRGTNDGLWDWNLKTDEVYYSPRWKAMLGFDDDEVPPTVEAWLSLIHEEDGQRVRQKIADHIAERSATFEDEHRVRHRDGSFRWVLCRGFAVRDGKGVAYRMAGAQTDVTDRRSYDPLTGLPNRAMFAERVDQAIQRGRRHPELLFAVLFVDLDRFKLINDSLGHLVGDQLLVSVAHRFEACVRPGDVVSRFGGDEFAIYLDGIHEATDAIRVAERIQRELQAPVRLDSHEAFTSASVGIALSTTGYTRSDEVLRDADTAMYRAKGKGKARHEVFDEAMRGRVTEALQLESDLRRAIERHEFQLEYQPVVSIRTGAITGFEALLRWQHPTRGAVLPAAFVPMAEETGLIVPIGDWVLAEACGQAIGWAEQRRHLSLPQLAVSVNVAARQFQDEGFVDRVAAVLTQTGLDAKLLRLEITEGMLIEASASTTATVEALRNLGVRFDIDDFGTGYSSLSYLHRFPLTTLKIDRSFVAKIGEGEAAVVKAILNMAHGLEMNVIAEGVETKGQLRILTSLGCDQVQGYYFSKPMDTDAARRMAMQPRIWNGSPGGGEGPAGGPLSAGSAHALGINLEGSRILVVEDDEDSRDMLVKMVGVLGATVCVAVDGEEALRIAREQRPDLILCDIRMPNLDGYGFIRSARRDDFLSSVRIVAVSSFSGAEDKDRTWKAGFNGHLEKPLEMARVETLLTQQLWNKAHQN